MRPEQALLPMEELKATPALTISEATGSTLLSEMRRASDWREAALIVARSPKLLAECRSTYADVERVCAPAGREAVYVALQPCVLLWGRPDFGKGEEAEAAKRAWVRVYGDALCKLSRESLKYAVDEWIKKGTPFFPRPSDLYKLAEPVHLKASMIAYRMKKALELADAGNAPRDLTPEECAERKKLAAEVLQTIRASRGPNPLTDRARPSGTAHAAAERYRGTAAQ